MDEVLLAPDDSICVQIDPEISGRRTLLLHHLAGYPPAATAEVKYTRIVEIAEGAKSRRSSGVVE